MKHEQYLKLLSEYENQYPDERVNVCHYCKGVVFSDSTGTYDGLLEIDVCHKHRCINLMLLEREILESE